MAKLKKLYVSKLVKKDCEIPFYHEIVEKDFQRFFTEEENNPQVQALYRMYNIDPSMMSPIGLLSSGEDHHHDDGTPCEDVCICGPMLGHHSENNTGTNTTYYNLIKTIEDTENANVLLSFPKTDFPEYTEHLKYNKQHGISIEEFFIDADNNWDPIDPLS